MRFNSFGTVLPGAGTNYFEKHIQIYLNGQDPQLFDERIVCLSIFNEIDWTQAGNQEQCSRNAREVAEFSAKFSQDTCYSWDQHPKTLCGKDIPTNFKDSIEDGDLFGTRATHPIFLATVPLSSRHFRKAATT